MKQSALDYLKENIKTHYINYYRCSDNKWIYDLFDYDPFELFMEVPDFKLAAYSDKKGEMDLNNCKIVFSNLRKISESQASDERLWAGLCNKTFYSYCRTRWNYGTKKQKTPDADTNSILSRFFFSGGTRAGFYRNTLAKCWWVGHGTYQEHSANKFEILDALGADDLSTKVTDLFYSNTFASNPVITRGICMGWKMFSDRGIKLATREYFRPAVQYVNALGGGILLDLLTENEIRDIFVEYISQLYNKDENKTVFIVSESDEANDSNDTDMDEDFSDSENIISMKELQTQLDEMNDSSDDSKANDDCVTVIGQSVDESSGILLNKIMGKPKEVARGCTVIVFVGETAKRIKYIIPTQDSKAQWFGIYDRMIDKKVGYAFKFMKKTYEILDIMW